MKKILFLLIMPLMFSCNNNEEVNKDVDKDIGIVVPSKEDSLIDCNFGLKPHQFSKAKRLTRDADAYTLPKMAAKPPKKGSGVIYLDFDGYNLSGTAWTASEFALLSSGLITSEQQLVYDVVAKDYTAFPVIVTLSEDVYNKAPINKRIRVVLTESWQWYGTVGGVAYVKSFTWGDNTPCFVFSSLLGYDPFTIGKAASHEAGHTLGLLHKSKWSAACVREAEYASGFVMGWPYTQTSVFAVGPTPLSCTHIQDDVAMINQTLKSRP